MRLELEHGRGAFLICRLFREGTGRFVYVARADCASEGRTRQNQPRLDEGLKLALAKNDISKYKQLP